MVVIFMYVALNKLTMTVYPSDTLAFVLQAAVGVIVVICVYVAGLAWSWGPLGWLVPSEIQPLETRAAGMGISVAVNFLFSFVIGQAFLSMLCSMKFGIFLVRIPSAACARESVWVYV